MNDSSFLLEMKEIVKLFPGVRALDGVDFNLKSGEVHILLGENGAGKSTLMKILAGAYTPTSGEVFIEGKQIKQFSPIAAQKLGIGIIYQEFNLVPYLSVAENIFLDHMPMKHGFMVDSKKMHLEAKKVLQSMNMNVDTHALASEIPVAQQQMVEVAKALTHNLKVLIMDEPTSSLSSREIEHLFETIRRLKAKGIGIIYISHRLQEIPEIGDRITILRDGQFVDNRMVKDMGTQEMIRLMVGREIKDLYKRDYNPCGELMLKVDNLSSKKSGLKDVSIEVHKGEIVGLAGLVGAGRTELVRAIFHVDSFEKGQIIFKGKKLEKCLNPTEVIDCGISLIPEDRKSQGLSLALTVKENVVMASLDKLYPNKKISEEKEKEVVSNYVKELGISTPSINQHVKNLSGGNQQKVVLAKWLCTKADLIIFDEPTRGIDVGAKGEIYSFMNSLAANGKAIIMISSELPEIIGMSDRVYVMRDGKMINSIDRKDATQELILSYAMEGGREGADNE
ncbi:MAG: sugar ABC transporter ATP-binding protein [Sphaerochaetaceae bacterium]